MPTYFIGDVHGCNQTLATLLKRLQPKAGDKVVFLGDLIDRGPDSKGVVDTVWQLQASGIEVVCLRGNHEQMLLDALDDPYSKEHWLNLNGGQKTLESFGVSAPADLPEKYLDFFRAMPLWYETEGYLCVHAGLNFHRSDPLTDEISIVWIRRWYDHINYEWLGNRILLHGHTPMPLQTIEHQLQSLTQQQYLNLDNGCVYAPTHSAEGYGHLLAFQADTRQLYIQPFVG
ncbi:MAG: metallophosphoesterase family protein [Saprospiraceae bacterium]|nr:serine/threonine protein phosphatase [Saprospiraceae bacterium]MDW8229800.1 metallophosphoesterase family protein [Saprospiraceae bacterium]